MARLQTTVAIEVFGRRLTHDTHNIYEVRFFGDSILTTVTHDGAIVSQWISDVESIHRRRLQYLIVGLAVEWRPPFNSYSKNPVATIQLSVGRRCLIFRLIYCSFIPSSLVNFLANPNYTFVGVGINQNLEKLREDYQFGHNTNAVDLRSLAADAYGRKELKHAGVKELARVVLKKEVDKPKAVTMSRWDNQWLTPAQVQYACVDAFVCFEVGRILNASSSSSSTASSSSSAPVIASGQRYTMGLLCVFGGLTSVYFGEGVWWLSFSPVTVAVLFLLRLLLGPALLYNTKSKDLCVWKIVIFV